ncbi:proteoglycan Cow-like [Ylistrum balloti]|uniref:proteoglycan Cow-like n=1 Tax=Ylistrum balloti TaxID=509963 RepID=UPI002905EA06|nr:proteoglycan Cow-like [Ylistrum balloti]
MVGARLAPILVLAVLIWTIDAEHMKSRVHGEMKRFNLSDFKKLRREARGKTHHNRKNFLGKHTTLMIDQDDVLRKKHLDFTIETAERCTVSCERHEVCVKHTRTGNNKCVHKKYLKESHMLSKFKGHHKKNSRHHSRLMKERFGRLETRVNELDERPQNIRHKKIMAIKKAKKNGNDFVTRHRLIENMEAVDELMHLGEGRQSEISRKYPECTNKVEDIRQRLNDWFAILHTQKKEHRSKKFKRNHSKSWKPKHFRDFRTIGQCKCPASVMWERRTLDKDKNAYLDTSELTIIEDIHQEKCITPLLESCDTDKDRLLSKKEWCCCFSDPGKSDSTGRPVEL